MNNTKQSETPECKKCGQFYALREGQDPTTYCDECAHVVIEELERRLNESEADGWKRNYADALVQAEKERDQWRNVAQNMADLVDACHCVCIQDSTCQTCRALAEFNAMKEASTAPAPRSTSQSNQNNSA